jgi:hypothetical protein
VKTRDTSVQNPRPSRSFRVFLCCRVKEEAAIQDLVTRGYQLPWVAQQPDLHGQVQEGGESLAALLVVCGLVYQEIITVHPDQYNW